RAPRAYLRAVLLDEGARPRNGARPVHQRGDRPRAQGPYRHRQRRRPRQHVPGLPPGRGVRVVSEHPSLLVADDDEVARELLGEALGREGYRVSVVASGEECVRLAEREPFDLALVDLRMPGLDGPGALKRLAAIGP